MPSIINGTVFQNGGCSLLARIVGANGGVLIPSSVSTMTYRITDETTYPVNEVVDTTTLSPVSSYLFTGLRTDGGWSRDDEGYNFRLDISSGVLTSNGHMYKVEVWITPLSGPTIPIVFNLTTSLTYGP